MTKERDFQDYIAEQRRLQERLDRLRDEAASTLAGISPERPGAAAEKITALLREQAKAFQEQREQGDSFVAYLRKLEAARIAETKPAMPAKRAPVPRDQAEIERLSEELSLKLRLDRVDDAIKEVLAFLADGEFFAANANTGRKRRLRSLLNAIEKSLAA